RSPAMRQCMYAVVILSTAVGIAGCKGNKPAPTPPPPPKVTVVRPAQVMVSDYWTYNGSLDTTKAVEVRSKIRGFLKHVKFKEGAEVRGPGKNPDGTDHPGDRLYEIDDVEFLTANRKADAEHKKAEADLLKAEADIKTWEAQITEAKIELNRVKDAYA